MLAKLKAYKKLLALLLVLVLAGGWYLLAQGQDQSYTEYQVQDKDLVESLELSGKVSAAQIANMRFLAGGLVSYLGAKEGDAVKKYQTIASVDTRQTQKILEQKLNLYAIQRSTFDQTIDDNNNSVPDGDLGNTLKRLLEKNQYQLENVVKDVEYQDLAIRLSRLSSPIAGILVHSPIVVAGVNVSASDVWTVVDPASLEFVADLDESDLARVSVGQKVILTLDAYPDRTITTSIKSISFSPKEISSGTTYEVVMALPQEELASLRLGLNGTAEIILEEKSAVPTLPAQAVTYKGGQVEVLVKKDNAYITKTIKVGTETNNDLEISEGLSLGDIVYVKK